MEKTIHNHSISEEEVSAQEKSQMETIYKKIFTYAMKRMTKGHLRVIEKEGSSYLLGDASSDELSGLIHVNHKDFYKKSVFFGDVGFSESYLDGDWDTDNITNVLSWFLLNVEESPSLSGSRNFRPHIKLFNMLNRLYHLRRSNSVRGSKKNIVAHYDLGNSFYKLFLDKTMTYSSAYFVKDDLSLEEAQFAKYESLCSSLKLNSSHHVLEIGSGWGGFSLYAAKKYGCKITTVTISDEQFKYAKELFAKEGVSHLVDIQLKDYRYIEGQYDRIVSIEMLEAVGHKYFETYFAKCQTVLKRNGAMGLQVITSPDARYVDFKDGVDFIQKHIFPGSLLPSIGRLNEAINKTGNMHLQEIKDLGLSYAKTLNSWLNMFDKNISQVRSLGFDERFIRTWRYYLCYCEAAFKMRNINVVQLLYTRPNNLEL
ncbi:MAG: cyclopropane-fatty-acyl-phospholipid synthase family protein [Leptospiraceae bacterium]|nr:cyclopropane-fatty-acyl-phospholipid synthase family protein [Leptospiraceae bacterium]